MDSFQMVCFHKICNKSHYPGALQSWNPMDRRFFSKDEESDDDDTTVEHRHDGINNDDVEEPLEKRVKKGFKKPVDEG